MSETFDKCRRPGCENAVTQPSRGRRREYCSPACKQAHFRARQVVEVAPPPPVRTPFAGPPPEDAVGGLLFGVQGTSDEQLVGAILQTQALIQQYSRLARDARGQFAWRAQGMAEDLTAALGRYFGEAVDGDQG